MKPDTYNTIQLIISSILVASVVINTIVWGGWFFNKTYRTKDNYAVGPFLFSLHALIFMLATFLNLVSYQLYFIWRNIITTHAIILLISYGIIMRNKVRSAKK
jgi:hypothetical protein